MTQLSTARRQDRELWWTWAHSVLVVSAGVPWLRVWSPGADAGPAPVGLLAGLALPAVMAAGWTVRRRCRGPVGSAAACGALAGSAALVLGLTAGAALLAVPAPVPPGLGGAVRAGLVALALLAPLSLLTELLLRRRPVVRALRPGRRVLQLGMLVALLMPGVAHAAPPPVAELPPAGSVCGRIVRADVVALDQPIVLNRMGAGDPTGMVFALRRDVEPETGDVLAPGNAVLRPDRRPRPLVLRVPAGGCLRVTMTNLLDPVPLGDQPATRDVGLHITGLQLAGSIQDDGSAVGANPDAPGRTGSLVPPGGTATSTWYAAVEGTHQLSSTADPVSGEGLLGTAAFGLFGAVNVEPAGTTWYRSQVSRAEMDLATIGTAPTGQPLLDWDAVYPPGHRSAGLPVLAVLAGDEIVHGDLHAVIAGSGAGKPSSPSYPDRERPFRELTAVFHDELHAVQAFPEFEQPELAHTLHGVKDGFAINYGASGMGSALLAQRRGLGPQAECTDCKAEEFFLSSWVVGDPAMLVDVPAGQARPGQRATRALYPDDPSNVMHGYVGERVVIRNVHVGAEHHVFHLHAHQWLETPDDDRSTYKDSQAIGPGSGRSYEIADGGGGNRNKTPGDALLHCHFYPHLVQGMWAVWRVHDVFEQGTVLDADGRPAEGARALPDGEISRGTPVPGVVPVPGGPMAPAPAPGVAVVQEPGLGGGQVDLSAVPAGGNPGFPFFVPGKAGHRPPTPPLDLIDDGGLPRHVVTGGEAVAALNPYDMSSRSTVARAHFLPEGGTAAEVAAMAAHRRPATGTSRPDGSAAVLAGNGRPPVRGAPFADPCPGTDGTSAPAARTYQGAGIELDLVQNKAGWHFPQSRVLALWKDVADTLAGTRPPEPLVMRAGSGECVEYQHVNLLPHEYQQDAFQVRTPTDVVGQHVHLVKFDVLASDGAANGFNYEDGTLAPAEVRERITALQAPGGACTGEITACSALRPAAHPFFGAGPGGDWLGARTTAQRWWVNPVRDRAGVDRTVGTVFTHDHFSPSTHQQTGLYGALLAEPAGSTWRDPETGERFGGRSDGGPTSWRADIVPVDPAESRREFFLAVQDFQLGYEKGREGSAGAPRPDPEGAVNPPSTEETDDRRLYRRLTAGDRCPGAPHDVGDRGCPELVSASDPGGFAVNYRNEPLALRLRDPVTGGQAAGEAGDPALAHSSRVRRADPRLEGPGPYRPLTAGVGDRDPFTPLLRTYDGDRVDLRVVVGAHEEMHTGTVHGMSWLREHASPDSGWRNAQVLGLSEQVSLQAPLLPSMQGTPRAATDYRWSMSASTDGAWTGAWGLLRSHSSPRKDLLRLPGGPWRSPPDGSPGKAAPGGPGKGGTMPQTAHFDGPCPAGAPVVRHDVSAVLARDALPGGTLVYNGRRPEDALHDPTAVLHVRSGDLDPSSGRLRPGVPVEPLVLRVRAGDCVDVTLRNRLPERLPDGDGRNSLPPVVDGFNANDVAPSSLVGLRPQLLTYLVSKDEGGNVGMNDADQTVRPGKSRTYRWWAGDVRAVDGAVVAAPVEYGATNLVPADPLTHAAKGAVGALVVEPAGSTWTEDATSRASATVRDAKGAVLFREQVLVVQDDVDLRRGPGEGTALPSTAGGSDPEDSGGTALNYRTEPLWLRAGLDPEASSGDLRDTRWSDVLTDRRVGGAPQTPVLTAEAGTPVRIRLLKPGGHARDHSFAVHGHTWQRSPHLPGSRALGTSATSTWTGTVDGFGPTDHADLLLPSAGGRAAVPGDYLVRDMTPGRFYGGAWALLRVGPRPR